MCYLSTTFLLADINEKCESASNSKHQENYLQLSSITQTIQFWPMSDEKKDAQHAGLGIYY